MNNEQIAAMLAKMASLLEMKGEERFKVVAYQKAARAVGYSSEDVNRLAVEGRLTEIPGVGKGIAAKIQELLATGHMQEFDDLQAQLPEGAVRLLEVPGIGPKLAHRIATELPVMTLQDLEAVILDGRLAALPGLGPKKAEALLKSLQSQRAKSGRNPAGQSPARGPAHLRCPAAPGEKHYARGQPAPSSGDRRRY